MRRTFVAPGRVNLIGEHTDYTGGLVLPAAIDQGVTLRCESAGARIRLTSDGYSEPADVPADGSTAPQAGWARFVASVAAELDALGRPPVGLDGHVRADLPAEAGLSSSAALEVAVALALCAVADFTLEPLQIAQACRRAERRAVGVPSGIMDQAASMLGRADSAVLLDCTSLHYQLVPLPTQLRLVIIDSGVARRLEDSDYGRRRDEAQEALRVLEGGSPADVEAAEALERARAAGLDGVLVRRLRHIVTENARVRAVAAALKGEADLDALGELFAQGHASLRDDFEVSTPELDLLVTLAVEAGAVAARLTGAGFGGSIVALARDSRARQLGADVATAYHARTGRQASTLVTRAGDGAREV